MYDELDGEIDELLDEWMSDGADAFLLRGVRSLMQAGQQVFRRMPALGATQGPRVEQLLRTRGGVLLEGATPDQARRWAEHIARSYGANVTNVEAHRNRQTGQMGLPHFHIEGGTFPGGRSGHIYFGTPPQTWFDAPY